MVEWLGEVASTESVEGHAEHRSYTVGEGGLCLLLTGLFNHYQGHPDGSVHILTLVLVTLNIEHGSRLSFNLIFIHGLDVTQQQKQKVN